MTATLADGVDPDRWLAGGQAGSWEHARVVAVDRGESATTLRLLLPTTPELLAGQYYLVRVAIDRPPGAVQQAYSLSSSPFPVSSEVEITVRAVKGGRASPLLADRIAIGDRLEVRGPYGFLTWSETNGGPLVLIGGGSGVVPLVSIVRYAASRQLEVPMTMLCSSRDQREVLLRDRLERLDQDNEWFRLVHTFTRSAGDPHARYHRRIDASMLADVVGEAETDGSRTVFYVAGPVGLVLAVRHDLEELGVEPAAIYDEHHA